MSKYHRPQKWFEAIVDKLGGEDSAMSFLRGELIVVPNPSCFLVWKTIRIGTGLKTPDEFQSALKYMGMKIGAWGKDLLGRPSFSVSEEETELDLVNVSVGELGFFNNTSLLDIFQKVLDFGLQLCPAEVGPQLRLQHTNQPKRQWLMIGMEPIIGSDGNPYIFFVAEGHDEHWLHAHHGEFGRLWDANKRFIFVRPRQIT